MKVFGGDSGCCFVLGVGGEGVLVFVVDVEGVGEVFGGNVYVVVVKGVLQVVLDYVVLQVGVVEMQVVVGVMYQIGSIVYVFLVVGDNDFGVVVVDCLYCLLNCFQFGVVYQIDGDCWSVDWQVGLQCGLVCWVLFVVGGKYLVENQFVDCCGGQLVVFKQVVYYCCVEVDGGKRGEGVVKVVYWGVYGSNNGNIGYDFFLIEVYFVYVVGDDQLFCCFMYYFVGVDFWGYFVQDKCVVDNFQQGQIGEYLVNIVYVGEWQGVLWQQFGFVVF